MRFDPAGAARPVAADCGGEGVLFGGCELPVALVLAGGLTLAGGAGGDGPPVSAAGDALSACTGGLPAGAAGRTDSCARGLKTPSKST